MSFGVGYYSTGIAHLLENKDIQAVIGYRRHTHATETPGKYRFQHDWEHDCYTCPQKHHHYWKTPNGNRLYNWPKQTIIDPLRKLNRTMAYVLPVCSEFKTCASCAS